MKLKLDLHPIYNDSAKIEAAMQSIIDQAIEDRITEVEIIPGKGSGQLKKTVIRFLDRPEIKAKYHRIEKDGDNWGRLFVHFRWERIQQEKAVKAPRETATFACFCCAAPVTIPIDKAELLEIGSRTQVVDCPSCGSPNKVRMSCNSEGIVQTNSESGYE